MAKQPKGQHQVTVPPSLNPGPARGGQPDPTKELDPGKTLVQIMGRRLVIILAVGSVLGAVGLCTFAFLRPDYLVFPTGRFFLCVLASFLFAVFVFTLFPANFELDLGRYLQIPLTLFGPSALWVGLFVFLWHFLPVDPVIGKVLKPDSTSPDLFYSTTWVLKWEPTEPVFYMLQGKTQDRGSGLAPLEGFYIEFDDAHRQYTAEVGQGGSIDAPDRYKITFDVKESTYVLKSVSQ